MTLMRIKDILELSKTHFVEVKGDESVNTYIDMAADIVEAFYFGKSVSSEIIKYTLKDLRAANHFFFNVDIYDLYIHIGACDISYEDIDEVYSLIRKLFDEYVSAMIKILENEQLAEEDSKKKEEIPVENTTEEYNQNYMENSIDDQEIRISEAMYNDIMYTLNRCHDIYTIDNVKLYKVTFLEYTDPTKDTIKGPNGEYINVPNDMIISEKDIAFFSKCGGGFEDLKFVGYLKRHT